MCLFLERGEGREKERDRNISVWLPLTRPPLGTQPAPQAWALTGNRTGDLCLQVSAQSTETRQPRQKNTIWNKQNWLVISGPLTNFAFILFMFPFTFRHGSHDTVSWFSLDRALNSLTQETLGNAHAHNADRASGQHWDDSHSTHWGLCTGFYGRARRLEGWTHPRLHSKICTVSCEPHSF